MKPSGFLPPKGNFRSLILFQKAQCIYDITYYFAKTYLPNNDRTIDQMVQAARSGRQNIAEGSAASATSSETEIKLMNVARASMQELLLDYEDFLRVRNLSQWGVNDPRNIQTRRVCARHNDSEFYIEAIKQRSPETIANIAITLIHQTDVFFRKLLKRLQDDFVKNGGIREAMTRARLDYRNGRKTN